MAGISDENLNNLSLKNPTKLDIIFNNLIDLVKIRGDDAEAFKKYIDIKKKDREFIKSIDFPVGKQLTIPRLYSENICILLMFDLKQEYKKTLLSMIKNTNEDPTPDQLKTFLDEFENRTQYIYIFLEGKPINTNDRNTIVKFDKLLQEAGCISHDFSNDKFMYNPLKHRYTPPHRKLSKEEVVQFMEKYMVISKSKISHILKTDIISKWIGLKVGDIVEITRQSPTSGSYKHYRVCV